MRLRTLSPHTNLCPKYGGDFDTKTPTNQQTKNAREFKCPFRGPLMTTYHSIIGVTYELDNHWSIVNDEATWLASHPPTRVVYLDITDQLKYKIRVMDDIVSPWTTIVVKCDNLYAFGRAIGYKIISNERRVDDLLLLRLVILLLEVVINYQQIGSWT